MYCFRLGKIPEHNRLFVLLALPHLNRSVVRAGVELDVQSRHNFLGCMIQARAHIHNFNVVNAPGPYTQGGCGTTGGGSCAFDNTGTMIVDNTSRVVFTDNHIRVLAIETERAIVWANFLTSLQTLMGSPNRACLALEPADHMQQV